MTACLHSMAKDRTLFVQIYLSGNWSNSRATLLLVITFSKSIQSGSTMIPPIQSIFHIFLSDQKYAKLHFEPPQKGPVNMPRRHPDVPTCSLEPATVS